MRRELVDRLAGTRFDAPLRRLYVQVRGKRMSPLERRNRAYDDFAVDLIRKEMKRDSNSVDAGAHKGYFLRHLVRAAPLGTHFAFEPIPDLAEELRRRVPVATVFASALGDREGTVTFHYLPDKAAQSSLHTRPERERDSRVVELTVPIQRLDAVWPPEQALTFVKIDVEGAELELIRGASATLARCRPIVVFECDPTGLSDVAELLAELGLQTFLVEDYHRDLRRPVSELAERAAANGEWFFAARP